MTRSSPDSLKPRSARNVAASAASSCAISSSIFAQTATAAVPARERNGFQPAASAAGPVSVGRGRGLGVGREVSSGGGLRLVEIDHDEERVGREKLKPAQPFEIFAFELE